MGALSGDTGILPVLQKVAVFESRAGQTAETGNVFTSSCDLMMNAMGPGPLTSKLSDLRVDSADSGAVKWRMQRVCT